MKILEGSPAPQDMSAFFYRHCHVDHLHLYATQSLFIFEIVAPDLEKIRIIF